MCELWLDRSVWARLLQLEREDVDRVFVCGRALHARRSRVSRIEPLQRKGPQEMAKKRHSGAVMGERQRERERERERGEKTLVTMCHHHHFIHSGDHMRSSAV